MDIWNDSMTTVINAAATDFVVNEVCIHFSLGSNINFVVFYLTVVERLLGKVQRLTLHLDYLVKKYIFDSLPPDADQKLITIAEELGNDFRLVLRDGFG